MYHYIFTYVIDDTPINSRFTLGLSDLYAMNKGRAYSMAIEYVRRTFQGKKVIGLIMRKLNAA